MSQRSVILLGGLLVALAGLTACNLPQSGVGTPYAPAPALFTAAAQTVSAAVPEVTPTPNQSEPTLVVSPTPSPVAVLAVSPTIPPTLPPLKPDPPKPSYQIEVRWDGGSRISAAQRIRFRNPADIAVESITLQVDSARQPSVFTLDTITWETASASLPVTATLRGGALDLALPGPLGPDAQAEIALSYTLTIPEIGGFLGQTNRQINLGDWFPRLPVYQSDVGWVVHDPSSLGETQLYQDADFSVRLLLPDGWIAAASAPARPEDSWLVYYLEGARSFTFSFSREYQFTSASQAVTDTVGSRSVELFHYAFANHTVPGQAALETMQRAVALYSALFGPYPDAALSMVEGDFFDGMESDGLFFLGQEYYTFYDGTPANYLVALTAHEVSHQWWYSMVGNDQALEPWLDEALATYSELLYYERYHPDLVEWWWEYRVQRFGPGGWVNSRVYDFSEFRPYINAVYLRGAMFIGELRALMGDENFFAFLKTYTAEKTGQIVTAPDFWEVLGRYLDPTELEPLRRQYFR